MEKNKFYEKKTKIIDFFKKNYKMIILVTYIIANLVYLTIGSYIYTTEKLVTNFTYEKFSFGLRNLLILNTIVFFIYYIAQREKKNLAYFFIALIAIFGIISAIFSIDRNISLYGCIGRNEGLYSIMYYLSIFLLSTLVSEKNKKILINAVLVCGTIQACYAICQIFQIFNVKVYWHTYKEWNETLKKVVEFKRPWAIGFTSNRNFFGTYMLLCLSYSLGLFVDYKNIVVKIIYGILIALFTFGLLISNTLSVWIGLAFVLLSIIIYCIKNKKIVALLIIAAVLFDVSFLAVRLKKTDLIRDIKINTNETTQIAKGSSKDSYGSNRVFVWKNTIKIIPKHLWHGVGIDNFAKAFDGGPLKYNIIYNKKRNKVDHIMIFDKAHNEYLQTLITQGIFALISYLALYGYALIKGIKKVFKDKQIYLVLPLIGYLVQAFFNISVIEVAPIFFIALGLCCENNIKKNKILNLPKGRETENDR